jgi:hypothetical protein
MKYNNQNSSKTTSVSRRDGVMVGANPIINNHPLPQHLGGYLPFSDEISEWLRDKNQLTVEVDFRWLNVPAPGHEIDMILKITDELFLPEVFEFL